MASLLYVFNRQLSFHGKHLFIDNQLSLVTCFCFQNFVTFVDVYVCTCIKVRGLTEIQSVYPKFSPIYEVFTASFALPAFSSPFCGLQLADCFDLLCFGFLPQLAYARKCGPDAAAFDTLHPLSCCQQCSVSYPVCYKLLKGHMMFRQATECFLVFNMDKCRWVVLLRQWVYIGGSKN